jgi:Ca2+-binding RTX toxin-like protein
LGDDFIDGQGGDDELYGDAGNDSITGGEGNDILDGGEGNDNLDGGEGNDRLFGDAIGLPTGNDSLLGGNGDDFFQVYGGNDTIDGGAGSNDSIEVLYFENSTRNITYTAYDPTTGSGAFSDGRGNSVTYSGIERFDLSGGSGNDDLRGGNLNDRLSGNQGNDTLSGGDGNDRLAGEAGSDSRFGNDSLLGGNGDDFFEIYGGRDTIDGGAGSDDTIQVRYDTKGNITYTAYDPTTGSGAFSDGRGNSVTYSGIERFDLSGGSGNDDLRGGNLDDLLIGNSGNDILTGGAGNDILQGFSNSEASGKDLDTLTGGSGADVFVVGDVSNPYLGTGNVTVTDFSLEQGDRILLYQSADLYNLQLGSFGGSDSIQDTAIFSGTDLIGVVQDVNLIGTNAFIYS